MAPDDIVPDSCSSSSYVCETPSPLSRSIPPSLILISTPPSHMPHHTPSPAQQDSHIHCPHPIYLAEFVASKSPEICSPPSPSILDLTPTPSSLNCSTAAPIPCPVADQTEEQLRKIWELHFESPPSPLCSVLPPHPNPSGRLCPDGCYEHPHGCAHGCARTAASARLPAHGCQRTAANARLHDGRATSAPNCDAVCLAKRQRYSVTQWYIIHESMISYSFVES